jgi:hypothetical protein
MPFITEATELALKTSATSRGDFDAHVAYGGPRDASTALNLVKSLWTKSQRFEQGNDPLNL